MREYHGRKWEGAIGSAVTARVAQAAAQSVQKRVMSMESEHGAWTFPRPLVRVGQEKVLYISGHSCVIKAAWHLKLHKKYDAVLISEQVSAQASLSEAEDLSGLLVQISVAIREKGVSREQVQELLEEWYRVRSQQRLKTEQLRDWLKFVRNFGRSIAGFAVAEA